MSHTYIALTDGTIVETNQPLTIVTELLTERWVRIPVRGYTGARYRVYALRESDIRCAWEQPKPLAQPWRPPAPDPDAARVRALKELIAESVGLTPAAGR